MPTSVHLLELSIPLRDPFANSATSIDHRTVLLVGIQEDELTGWGEAAPYPGISSERVSDLWAMVVASPDTVLSNVELPPTLLAAIEQARLDLAARRSGLPLWRHLGGGSDTVSVSVAIGIQPTPELSADAAKVAQAAGFQRVKLKIAPGRDIEDLAAIREAAPDLLLAADANGAYELDSPLFDSLDELGLSYIEQPLAAPLIAQHAMLRERLETAICLDESMVSLGSARDAIAGQAMDIACLKAGLLGPGQVIELTAAAAAADIAVKLGGLIETSVGRGHTLAVGCRAEVDHADLAPAPWYLAADVTTSPWAVADGRITAPAAAGLGFEVDELLVADVIERSMHVAIG